MKKVSSADDRALSRHVSVRQLRYFVAVVAHRNFRRAAESLCVSQPPLTRQVQALERSLGVSLIERSARRFALTSAGEAFHVEAKMLLAGLDRACETIRAFHQPRRRRFAIGMADDFVYSPQLERLLGAAERLGVDIELSVALSPVLESQLAHGIVDAALLNTPLVGDASQLTVRPLAPSRLCLLVRPDHPLAEQRSVQPSALRDVPLILSPQIPSNTMARQCEKLFVAGRLTPTVVSRTTSTVVLELLVQRGIGAGIATEFSVSSSRRLRVIPFESPESAYPHAVAYRSDRAASELVELLGHLQPDPGRTRVRRRARSFSATLR